MKFIFFDNQSLKRRRIDPSQRWIKIKAALDCSRAVLSLP
jgi:hypothetical protein